MSTSSPPSAPNLPLEVWRSRASLQAGSGGGQFSSRRQAGAAPRSDSTAQGLWHKCGLICVKKYCTCEYQSFLLPFRSTDTRQTRACSLWTLTSRYEMPYSFWPALTTNRVRFSHLDLISLPLYPLTLPLLLFQPVWAPPPLLSPTVTLHSRTNLQRKPAPNKSE